MKANSQTDSDGWTAPPAEAEVGPLTKAYLHGDVHPADSAPATKPAHTSADQHVPIFPKANAIDTNLPSIADEIWMYD